MICIWFYCCSSLDCIFILQEIIFSFLYNHKSITIVFSNTYLYKQVESLHQCLPCLSWIPTINDLKYYLTSDLLTMHQCMHPAGEQYCLCHHRSVRKMQLLQSLKENKCIYLILKIILYISIKREDSSAKGDHFPVNLEYSLDMLFISAQLCWFNCGYFSYAQYKICQFLFLLTKEVGRVAISAQCLWTSVFSLPLPTLQCSSQTNSKHFV